jgi:hypothetical protein
MKPIPELPASAVLLGSGLVHDSLEVVDVSVGGLALATAGALEKLKSGDAVRLRIGLSRYGEHTIPAIVRWTARGLTGVEYGELEPAATTAIRRYVAELLERGAPS